MHFKLTVEEAVDGLRGNRVRTALTMLGIVIGIGSVIAMISLGEGSKAAVAQRIQSIGSNLLTVSPGAQQGGGGVWHGRGSATTLTTEDASAISKEISDVTQVAPELSNRYQITYKGANTNTTVLGTTPEYSTIRDLELTSGSFLTARNLATTGRVAVLGPTTAEDLFGTISPVGQKIKINRISFQVVGVTESKGQTGFFNRDDIVFVPLTTAQRILSRADHVSSVSVQAVDESVMGNIQADISSLLLVRHNITNPAESDFSILSQADLLETATAVTDIFTILLSGIAGISLLVGGIGIMNMMLTTVTERTREIGLRKAIGARRRDITLQFLTEAVLLTFFGGVAGVVLGGVFAYAISQFAGIPTQISGFSVILAFGVSAVIGLVFGFYPARRAAALEPIEALRHN